jgi:hypothetical protein
VKTILAVIGGLVVLAVAVLMTIGWLAEKGIISGADIISDGSSSNSSVKETLVGRWQVETGNLKGATMMFTSSGVTTWVFPADIFGLTDCSVTGQYKIIRARGDGQRPTGTYVRSVLSEKSGNCKDSVEIPHQYDDKIDVVDANHLLFDTSSLVRTNQ